MTAAEGIGVIFDMDGVLVDSAEAHRSAWRQLGEEVGTPFSDALFAHTFGQRNASIIPAWLGGVSAARSEDLGARKEEIYRSLVRQGHIRRYAGVGELLEALAKAGARCAVASSGPRQNVALLIETLGIGGRIEVTVSAEDVREGKPDPEVFLTAAARLRIRPAACAVVEDSVHGIEAARRAGMLAVAVLTSTPREALLAAGAQLLVDEVGSLEAAEILSSIAAK